MAYIITNAFYIRFNVYLMSLWCINCLLYVSEIMCILIQPVNTVYENQLMSFS